MVVAPMLSICLNYDRGKGFIIVGKQILDITSSHSIFCSFTLAQL